jgi:hypothetical protein
MIAALEDIQDQYINELPDTMKHGMKYWMNKTRIATGQFIKQCDKALSREGQDGLEMASDNLRKIIEDAVRKAMES